MSLANRKEPEHSQWVSRRDRRVSWWTFASFIGAAMLCASGSAHTIHAFWPVGAVVAFTSMFFALRALAEVVCACCPQDESDSPQT